MSIHRTDARDHRRSHNHNHNVACAFRVAAIVSAAATLALFFEIANFATLFPAFLIASGTIRGTAAAIGQDPFWADHLNRWDEAAMLIMLGLLAHLLTSFGTG